MISALIPTYNDEDTIKMCLESIATIVDEVCIIDDGSSDDTTDIIAATMVAGLSCDVYWRRNETRKGWVDNRNALMSMADHEVVLVTDSDCVLRDDVRDVLRFMAEGLSPGHGYYLKHVALVGDIFHTNARVIEGGMDPNHVLFRRRGGERWFSVGAYSSEGLSNVSLETFETPMFFHLKSVKSDFRNVQRHHARSWFAVEDEGSFTAHLMSVSETKSLRSLSAWIAEESLRICLCEDVQPYDPVRWFPYPTVMQSELDNPRYVFVYDDSRRIVVGREKRW